MYKLPKSCQSRGCWTFKIKEVLTRGRGKMQGGRGLRHPSELCFAPFEIEWSYMYTFLNQL